MRDLLAKILPESVMEQVERESRNWYFTSMFCLSISWLFQRGFALDSGLQRLNVVPILGGCFDVMENVWIMALIVVYPAQPTAVAWLSTISTTGKYISGIPIVLLLLIGLVKAGCRWRATMRAPRR